VITTKTIEMEESFQNEMSKKNEELDELRRNLDELLAKPPVEVIKEVEKIVEDPVTSNKLSMLQDTLQNLRTELQEKKQQINELEKINRELLNGNTNQAYLLRGSNLNRRI
jgi:flagellar biosynthesis chaperone FliJ